MISFERSNGIGADAHIDVGKESPICGWGDLSFSAVRRRGRPTLPSPGCRAIASPSGWSAILALPTPSAASTASTATTERERGIEYRGLGQLRLPVPMLDTLRPCNSQQRFRVGVGIRSAGRGKPVPRIDAHPFVYGNADRRAPGKIRLCRALHAENDETGRDEISTTVRAAHPSKK